MRSANRAYSSTCVKRVLLYFTVKRHFCPEEAIGDGLLLWLRSHFPFSSLDVWYITSYLTGFTLNNGPCGASYSSQGPLIPSGEV